ncbi:hypothetical protein N658DRAFT_242990 [Parathielavia hyrcaniae]|uniref:Uncharacterized protein n=1 Tax=Parathielavia hyrcaniae TaxID=113614 RepID=A0AAN6Q8E8_9PEZI|nr:hypothetical protein N658DRAFT_242990 [Parathielavia hyrcaniae]
MKKVTVRTQINHLSPAIESPHNSNHEPPYPYSSGLQDRQSFQSLQALPTSTNSGIQGHDMMRCRCNPAKPSLMSSPLRVWGCGTLNLSPLTRALSLHRGHRGLNHREPRMSCSPTGELACRPGQQHQAACPSNHPLTQFTPTWRAYQASTYSTSSHVYTRISGVISGTFERTCYHAMRAKHDYYVPDLTRQARMCTRTSSPES